MKENAPKIDFFVQYAKNITQKFRRTNIDKNFLFDYY